MKNFRTIPHDRIDRATWDHCVMQDPNGLPYAQSWFLDVVAPEWSGLVYGDYELVFPLTCRKKWGMTYMMQPPFTQQLGWFGHAGAEVTTKDILSALPGDIRLIVYNLHQGIAEVPGTEVRWNRNVCLDLSSETDDIRKGYSTNLKRNLKRAANGGIVIQDGNDLEPVIRMFRENRGKDLAGLNDAIYDVLRNIYRSAMDNAGADILYAFDPEGSLMGGVMFLQWKDRTIFSFSGLSEEGKKQGAMAAIVDEMIGRKAGRAGSMLDFEGSNDENLARFYMSFGSQEMKYATVRINRLPWYVKWLKRG